MPRSAERAIRIRALALVLAVLAIAGGAPAPPAGAQGASGLHENFYVVGDAQLAARAAVEGWPGDGSPGNPFVIEGYELVPAGGSAAIRLRQTTLHVLIRNNHVHDGFGDGIWIHSAANVVLEGNAILDTNRWAGISIVSSSDVVVRGNTIRGSPGDGLYVSGGARHLVEGNRIESVRFGIQAGASEGRYVGNVISAARSAGFWDLTRGSEISRNTISGSPGGIVLLGSGTRIVENEITGTWGDAIQVRSRADAGGHEIARNRLHDVGNGVHVYAAQSPSMRIADNDVRASGTGIRVDGLAGVTISGNRVSGGATGIALTNAARHVVAANGVEDAGTGILLHSLSDATLRGNRLEGNGLGLHLNVSPAALVFDNLFSNAVNVKVVDSPRSAWSVDKATGPNVLGGPFVGGNFWSDYTGADADGDGLGEIPHGFPELDPAASLPPVETPRLPVRPPSPRVPVDPEAELDKRLTYGVLDRAPLLRERVALSPPDVSRELPVLPLP